MDAARDLTAEEEAFVRAEADLLGQVGASARETRVAGHLRLLSEGREFDVLLGEAAQVEAPVPIIRWDTAPLAVVFFESGPGTEYEVNIDGRRLGGKVLRRAELSVDAGRLVGVTTDEFAAWREAERWVGGPAPRVRLAVRPESRRGQRPSPLAVTLDPVQRGAVEQPADRALLVLGDAGYGKTTVALHRITHLALQAQAAGRRFRGLVIVPSEGLRRLSTLALERLGVPEIEVRSFDDWIVDQGLRVFAGAPRRLSRGTRAAVIGLKRHPAIRVVLPEVARGTAAMHELGESDPTAPARREDLLHLFGDRVLVERIVEEARGGIALAAIEETLAHTRVQFRHRTESPLVAVDNLHVDEGTELEDADTIDAEDFTVLFELNRLKTGSDRGVRGRLAQYDHVVVDEAQELSTLELAVVGRAVAPRGAVTVAGDAKQAIDPGAGFAGWDAAMRESAPAGHLTVELRESYRCPPAVERIARGLFGARAPRPRGEAAIVTSRFHAPLHLHAMLPGALDAVLAVDHMTTIAVILRTAAAAQRMSLLLARAGFPNHLALGGDVRFSPGAQVTCVDEVRGLEFDTVVIPDATPGTYPEEDLARNAFYVAMTRATHCLWLCTVGSWTPLLGWESEQHPG